MKKTVKNRAFTLIELLVVVLIIGILAAIAVPQYQKAVYKSRAVEAVSLLKALANAEEVYYLANGEYTGDITELDVLVPEELQTTWGNPLFDDKYSYTCARKSECSAGTKNGNLPGFQFNFIHSEDAGVDAGKHYCIGGSDIRNSICRSMGKVDESRTESWAVGKYFIIN